MTSRVQSFRAALLLLAAAATGCSAIAEKVNTVRSVSAAMKPGHSYRSFYMPSGSMAPTIRAHADQVLVDLSAYGSADPQRGDIIVFMPPLLSKQPYIKRVIALPGDRLEIRNGSIQVNGLRW